MTADPAPSSLPLLGEFFFDVVDVIIWVKIVTEKFYVRAPDSAPVKSKMVYAGSKDALTRVLVGISVKLNATDRSECTLAIVEDACRKFA
jgi:hypothetical protein